VRHVDGGRRMRVLGPSDRRLGHRDETWWSCCFRFVPAAHDAFDSPCGFRNGGYKLVMRSRGGAALS
jgi:hypothetical protein